MYTVPVIPPDLRHEETIIQAAMALDCLHTTITNIFDRIDKRIAKNNSKIDEIKSRVNSASKKIENLSGTNKAIKIFSPAKFPSSHVFRDIELTFKNEEGTSTNVLHDYEIASRVDPVPNNIQDKLVFFHFRSAKSKFTSRLVNHRFLGGIPADVNSVNSVLLFSTAENAYSVRRAADEMNRGIGHRSKGIRKVESDKNRGPLIEPAPMSLSNRQKGADKRLHQGLFYTPRLHEAPVIDLPLDLPDLPGIADDIQFDHADNHQIAPSLFIENITDLPEIGEPICIETESKDQHAEDLAISVKQESKSQTVVVSSPPPPPPPPPTMIPKKGQLNTDGSPLSTLPPPPPPPLPPMLESPKSEQPIKSSPEPLASDAHSDLMDAIRKAGGARGGRLRAAEDVARAASSDKLNTNSNQPKAGGDLMADLHNKLLMRRKGISGAKEGEVPPKDSGDVISRLSALIPPPKARTQHSSSDDDEGDEADWA